MHFEILGDLADVDTIATGSGIREIARLRKRYGRGRWRKRKGHAEVRLGSDETARAELHCRVATGIAKREFKITTTCRGLIDLSDLAELFSIYRPTVYQTLARAATAM